MWDTTLLILLPYQVSVVAVVAVEAAAVPVCILVGTTGLKHYDGHDQS